jgi:hypothetical protein
VDNNDTPSYVEIFNVLRMTEFFLKEHFFKFNNLVLPKSRANIWQYFEGNIEDECKVVNL